MCGSKPKAPAAQAPVIQQLLPPPPQRDPLVLLKLNQQEGQEIYKGRRRRRGGLAQSLTVPIQSTITGGSGLQVNL